MNANFTDLVLLVGTNPLPNYVAIKYFLKCNRQMQQIWLVYSENTALQSGTGELADNIQAVIKDEFANSDFKLLFKFVPLNNVGSASSILRDLKRGFESPGNATFHLNYTGGTKSMAVQTYKYFFEVFGERCTFSYLDGREFKLKSDEDEYITNDLRYEIGISLDNLIKLHGYEKGSPQDNPIYPETIKKFEEIINQGKLTDFLKWKKENIRKVYYDKKCNFIKQKSSFLKHNNLSSQDDIDKFKQEFKKTPDIILELLRTIPLEKSILDENGDIWVPGELVTNNEYKERLKSTVTDFLDGKWLEVYVYNVITQGIQNDDKLKELYEKGQIEVADNWTIRKKGSGKDFELDVILLNGYQVCGISCTTDPSHGLCKSKGFEVMHRTKQIGGEEAKSILVSCISDVKDQKTKKVITVEDFYEDLKDISGSSSHEFLALGLRDLKSDTLWRKIRNHIWGDDV